MVRYGHPPEEEKSLADEMEAHPYDSTDWQYRWAEIRQILSKIAGENGPEAQ